eukprot:TRINITY_DN23367_c0_g1_i1.p1 TRINITY_DN23367_c0_g1~~TRINITY_DN23367_c0_g1_i1.p1  ORF type:complete len:445 (-),score=75.27 TRINITY_DN23367_c0_g1_i1:97-1338(-)
MRDKVIKELIDTERVYVDSLRFFVEYVYNPLEQSSIADKDTMSAIFSNITQLLAVNQEFLRNLENQSMPLGDTLYQIGDYFRSYSFYCNRHAEGVAVLHGAVKRSKDMQAYFSKVSPNRGLYGIEDMLIKPVQRICKYPLLLRELLRYTPPAHPDRAKLESALEKIQSITKEINEKKRDVDSSRLLIEIDKVLVGDGFEVIAPTRRLVKRGTVKKHGKKTSKSHLILFNDVLLVTSPKIGGKYDLKDVVDLSVALVNGEPDIKVRNAFELINVPRNKKHNFSVGSAEERDEWIEALNSIINEHLERGVMESKKRTTAMLPTSRRPLPEIPEEGRELQMRRFFCMYNDTRLIEMPKNNCRFEDMMDMLKRKFGIVSCSAWYISPSNGEELQIVSQGELDRCMSEGVRDLLIRTG